MMPPLPTEWQAERERQGKPSGETAKASAEQFLQAAE
jgi:hypothetical protein